MHWYDKVEKTKETILNCQIIFTSEEIEQVYKNGYIMRDENNNDKELTIEEAKKFYENLGRLKR